MGKTGYRRKRREQEDFHITIDHNAPDASIYDDPNDTRYIRESIGWEKNAPHESLDWSGPYEKLEVDPGLDTEDTPAQDYDELDYDEAPRPRKWPLILVIVLLVCELAGAAALVYFTNPSLGGKSIASILPWTAITEADADFAEISSPVETAVNPRNIKASLQTDNLVVVQAAAAGDTTGTLYLFERVATGWACSFSTIVTLGSQGISSEVSELTTATPQGAYKLGFAFGTGDDPGIAMTYKKITSDIYWVTDPNSTYYNRWVDATKVTADWSSAEHMADYDQAYALGIVIQYNTNPIVAGAGSAFFIHCTANVASEGCITMSSTDLAALMSRIDDDAMIVIANGNDIYNY